MIFLIDTEAPRKEQSTARYLNAVNEIVQTAQATELRYIWSRLQDAGYVWRLAASAHQDLTSAKNRAIVRVVALFWGAGVRPETGEAPEELQTLLEQISFLLLAHRGLLANPLPTSQDRLSLFEHRKTAITYSLLEQEQLARSPFFAEGRKWLWDADIAIFCARTEESYAHSRALADYLEQFCLLPEDVGISQTLLKMWLHRRLVDQAWAMHRACVPYQWGGERRLPPMVDVFANIGGVLRPLAQGVSLTEAGLSRPDLIGIKERLVDWLPQAEAEPEKHLVGARDIARFKKEIMPLFDQVLSEQTSDIVG